MIQILNGIYQMTPSSGFTSWYQLTESFKKLFSLMTSKNYKLTSQTSVLDNNCVCSGQYAVR